MNAKIRQQLHVFFEDRGIRPQHIERIAHTITVFGAAMVTPTILAWYREVTGLRSLPFLALQIVLQHAQIHIEPGENHTMSIRVSRPFPNHPFVEREWTAFASWFGDFIRASCVDAEEAYGRLEQGATTPF